MTGTRLLACALLIGGCAAGKGAPAGPPVASGPLEAAGNRCHAGSCSCRPVDNYGRSLEPNFDEGAPAPGTKRFEFRTGRGYDPESITIDGKGTLEKNTASPEPTCGYVDLPPGQHRVIIRARAANPEAGQEPAVFIREYSPEKKSWYDTFQWRCGGEEMCSIGHMEKFLGEVKQVSRGIFDPCGSTRVHDVKWDAGRTAGAALLADFTVELTLEVYKFAPRFPHGAPTCKGPSPSEPAE